MSDMFNALMQKALESIGKINDPVECVNAISQILPYVAGLEGNMAFKDTVAEAEPEEKKTKAAEPKKAEAKEHKPLKMVKPSAEDVAKVEKAMEEEEILPPQEGESKEAIDKRRLQVIKKYGDMPISQAFADEKIQELLAVEFESLGAFREQVMKCFGIELTENADGEIVETSESGITAEQVEKLIQYYMHEADESADDCGSVKLDKFLTRFIPYMVTLYQIYGYSCNQICAAGQEMTDSKSDFGAGQININNAEALLCVLNELYKAA